MKKIILLLIMIFILSCKEQPSVPVLKKECKLPSQFTCLNCPPISTHYIDQLSPDGSKLLFSVMDSYLKILDLKTLEVKKIDIQTMLPKNIKYYGLSNAFWCPYDNNKIAAKIVTLTDTIGDGQKYVYGQNIIIISLDNNSASIITPKFLGPAGPKVNFWLWAWMAESFKNKDMFIISYEYLNRGYLQKYIYQDNILENYSQYPSDISIVNNNILTVKWDGVMSYYYLNNYFLSFADSSISQISRASFSPSGNKASFTVKVFDNRYPIDSNRLDEIWIIDAAKFLQKPISPVPVKIINLKEKFCMFSYNSYATFISESTLAVSMFKAGANFSYIHEIDIDGNYIRQLTFKP